MAIGWSVLRFTTATMYIGTIVVNYLANEGAFGETNAQVSAKHPTPLTPAAWAFSIWGIIFLSQGAACVYLFVNSSTNTSEWKARAARGVCPWWIAGWVFQCVWQVFFACDDASGMITCVVFIMLALFSFQKGLANLHALQHSDLPPIPSTVYSLFFVPTSINAAWLSVAASVAVLIAIESNSTADPLPYAIALVSAVLLAGIYSTMRFKDTFYGLTLLWSFVAVYGHQLNGPVVIRVLAIVAVSLLVPATLSAVLRRSSQPRRSGDASQRQLLEASG